VLLAAACAGEAPSDAAAPDLRAGGPATLADLVGPWQREPLDIDAGVRAAADRACRADPEFPPGVQLAAIDARGGGRLMTIYAGPGGTMAECSYVEVAADGSVTGSLSGWGTSGVAPLAPGRLAAHGGGGFTDGPVAVQYVIGRVGAGTARVVVDVEGLGPVRASLGNGWYLAWWETGKPPDPNGPGPHVPTRRYTVTAYDGSGQATDQAQE
jgi:hypothetical protein